MKNFWENTKLVLLVAAILGLITGMALFSFWVYTVLHPGSPWWGFFIWGNK